VRLVLLFSRVEVSKVPLLMKTVLMVNTFHSVMVILGFCLKLIEPLYFFAKLYVTWFGSAFSLLLKCSPGLGEVDAREVMGTEYDDCATIFLTLYLDCDLY